MMNVKKLLVLSIVGIFTLTRCEDSSENITPKNDAIESAETSAGGSASSYDDLTWLPPDTGGQHVAKPKGTTAAAFGYYVYLPSAYYTKPNTYPLLIFLHGKGERGNGTTELNKVLNTGIPYLIKTNQWKNKPRYPMIVVSPQYHTADGKGFDFTWGERNPAELKAFIEHIVKTYKVNGRRIYITGLSHGANGVYDYLRLQSDATSHVAAAAPIAGYAPNSGYNVSARTPIWTFCGGADGSIPKKYGNVWSTLLYTQAYNVQVPGPWYKSKFTVYPNVGHNSWMRTYDLSGMTSGTDPLYNPYNISLYDWFFQYKRSSY